MHSKRIDEVGLLFGYIARFQGLSKPPLRIHIRIYLYNQQSSEGTIIRSMGYGIRQITLQVLEVVKCEMKDHDIEDPFSGPQI
jgi:hypothetical protein